MSAAASRWRARAVLLALFALFFAPIVIAWALNVLAPDWLPFGRTNEGRLVEPPITVSLESASALDGGADPQGLLRDAWVLVHVGGGDCDDSCRRALVSMRQARLALDKDAKRVRRLWLVTRTPDARTVLDTLGRHAGLRIVLDPAAARRISEAGGSAAVYVVDPAGYLVLAYPDPDDAAGILNDLERLLRISKQD